MSIDKDQEEQKNDVGEDGQKKGRGLFGRLFGRRKKSVDGPESELEPESKLKIESEEDSVAPQVSVEDKSEGQVASGTLEGDLSVESEAELNAESELPSGQFSPAETGVVVELEDGALAEGLPETEKASFIDDVESVVVESLATTEMPESDSTVDSGADATPDKKEKRGLFSRLKQGLAKTRNQFVGTLDNLFYGDKEIDEEFLEELEEILLTSDLGVKTSYRLFSQIEEKVSHKELENPSHLRDFLQSEIGAILSKAEADWEINEKPYVIMTIGVNGVGKTTTIGKLASIFTKQKKKVVLGAADTFRAAAVEQLTVWAERAKVPIIKQSMGADPAAVAFDTVQSAIKREVDIVIIDTAGRLHTKVNLMDELKKIKRVLGKALPGAPHEVLLVLDANTGQNAITQAQTFHEAIGVTGLVMTKLDGTAKGGVVVGVCDQLGVPVRYIGIGESIEDLRSFDSKDFVHALFDKV